MGLGLQGISYDHNGNAAAQQNNRLGSVTNRATYSYDTIGQLRHEARTDGQPHQYLQYNVTGKVTGVYDTAAIDPATGLWQFNPTHLKVSFTYDDRGFRLSKTVYDSANTTTWYIRDASGQLLSLYEQTAATIAQKEVPIYGAGKLGLAYVQAGGYDYIYELKDHLGNVRATVSRSDSSLITESWQDYYPFVSNRS